MNRLPFDISELSLEQKYAFYKFKNGENMFITGPGGTGKTKLIQYLDRYASSIGRDHQVCALTGCAAILLGCKARTIHSWSSIKLARGPKAKIINDVVANKYATKTWRKIKTIIIDEVSMMSCKIFEVLEEIARIIRKNPMPFGGIQVILTGDFFQLPPVGSMGDPDTDKFCFESPIWNSVFTPKNHIQLTTMFRQKDPLYASILLEIRQGKLSEEHQTILRQYVKREVNLEETSGCVPIKLFAIRNKSDFVNQSMYNKLDLPEFIFEMGFVSNYNLCDTTHKISIEDIQKCRLLTPAEITREHEFLSNNVPCAKSLSLKTGAAVMCTVNLDMDMGICNGAQGIIIRFDKIKINGSDMPDMEVPVVKFSNGITMIIKPYYWQSEEYPCLAVYQIPLQLSWALTIHKIQGATLPMGEMDIGTSIFEYGQIYVALSRIRSLDGLYLINFNPSKIRANPKVIAFYEQLPIMDMEGDTGFQEFLGGGLATVESSTVDLSKYEYKDPTIKVVRL